MRIWSTKQELLVNSRGEDMPINEIGKAARVDDTPVSRVSSPAYGYREMPGLESERLDVLQQLENNLALLEDLHGRLRLVMAEVRTLIVR